MSEDDRVRQATAGDVNQEIDETARLRIAEVAGDPVAIDRRIQELDREWDTERVLEANASLLTLAGVLLGGLVSRRWLLLAGIVPAFLLQHALQGWCPPLELIRRLGVRTRGEIDIERAALRALKGDFDGLSSLPLTSQDEREAAAARAMRAAGR